MNLESWTGIEANVNTKISIELSSPLSRDTTVLRLVTENIVANMVEADPDWNWTFPSSVETLMNIIKTFVDKSTLNYSLINAKAFLTVHQKKNFPHGVLTKVLSPFYNHYFVIMVVEWC